jgi:hypothetical protein
MSRSDKLLTVRRAFCLLLLSSLAVAADHQPQVGQSVSWGYVPHENNFTIPLSETITTDCRTYGKGDHLSAQCWTRYSPATEIPINLSWAEIYNEVRVEGRTYTLSCRMLRLTSPCQPLVPGQNYWVEIKGRKKMKLSIVRPGRTESQWVTYEIMGKE